MTNNTDNQVDKELEECITEGSRRSFFLFAGAGSGKTHSLVELLRKIDEKWGKKLHIEHRNVAVITYTNAATDEIIRRLGYNELFHVSTIHSFLWNVIKPYQFDIKKYYKEIKSLELKELQEKLDKTINKKTKTYQDNTEKFAKLKSKLEKVEAATKKFIYNPNGDNLSSDSLNHADVIKIGSKMILENRLLQKVIVQQYPFFLVDESQDTKKELVRALFEIQNNFQEDFTLGFLGDIKQRIYTDGEENMHIYLTESWKKPVKHKNYRCAKRIITLANKIALTIDENGEQDPKEDAPEGFVHLFLVDNSKEYDTDIFEKDCCKIMSDITNDENWLIDRNHIKILTLEHLMAARRLGFGEFHDIISRLNKYQMSYLQGQITELSVFDIAVFPLLNMLKNGKGAESLELLKKYSPLLRFSDGDLPLEKLKRCREVVDNFINIISENSTIRNVVNFLSESQLFAVDELLIQAAGLHIEELDDKEDIDQTLVAWIHVMDLPISNISCYLDYIHGRTKYETHQGVKGLEFPRVLVIINDDEANGHSFSYDKLFGVKDLSKKDLEHRNRGEESSIERTTRLFYVTCTRAIESLALLMYTPDPQKAKETAVENGWFFKHEITILPNQ